MGDMKNPAGPGRPGGVSGLVSAATRDSRDNSPRRRGAQPEHVSAPLGRVLREVTRQRLAVRVHRLGPRPMLEIMREIAAGADLDDALVRYAEGNPDVLRALGADQFPPPPLRTVP